MSKNHVSGLALVCALSLAACSGGGGGSSPSPSPAAPDTTPPNTTLSSTPNFYSNQTTANFSVTSSETNSTFEARLDAGAFATVSASFSFANLADGAHTVEVRARDAASNVDASPATYTWNVDTQAPDTTIAGGPGSTTISQSASFTPSSPDNGVSFEASLDGAAFTTIPMPYSLSGLAVGAHTVQVRARDEAGNADATPASFSWTIVPATMPGASVVFPGPTALVEWVAAKVRGTASGSSAITGVTLTSSCTGANGAPIAPVTHQAQSVDGFQNWVDTVSVMPGDTCIVTVSVTDLAGQTNANAATTTLRNAGLVVSDMRGILYDPLRATLMAVDLQRKSLVKFRADGFAQAAADAQIGSGADIGGFDPQLDAANDRVLTNLGNAIQAVDLTTGDRTEIVSATADPNQRIDGSFAYDPTTNTVYGKAVSNSIIRIDVASGTRTVLTGQGVGTGAAFTVARTIRLDTSAGAPTRLLVAQDGGMAAVDLATGNRSLVNGANAFPTIHDFVVDAANDRLLLLVPGTSTTLQLATLSLVNGSAALLAGSSFEVATSAASGFVALDAAGTGAYVGAMDRAQIFRYNLPNSTLYPFYDTRVGTGAPIYSNWNIDLDEAGGAAVLYSSTLYPEPGIVKLDLGTGVRSVVSMNNGAGSGPILQTQLSIGLDRRPAAPAGNLLLVDEGFHRLVSANVATGARTLITNIGTYNYLVSLPWMLDAPRGKFLRGFLDGGSMLTLGAMDATSGVVQVMSAPYLGSGPNFTQITAAKAENLAGGGYRYIVADVAGSSQLFAVDPNGGHRTLVSSNGGPGSGPPFPPRILDLDVDSASRRAVVVGDSSLQLVDLVNGQRTSITGAGPALVGNTLSARWRTSTGVAYVKATYDGTSIIAVDLITGERALISR